MAQLTSDTAVMGGDIRSDSSTQLHNLGAKAVTPDGRAFRYVKCGGTSIVAGNLYDGPVDIGDHTNLTCAVTAAGASSITVTLGGTLVAADDYVGGYIVINDVNGEGFTYSIKSHPGAAASATLVVTLDDEETVVTALTGSSQATLVLNQYNGVIVHATTEAGIPVGVGNTQITNDQFGWLQTRGPVAILCNATTGIGLGVSASDTTTAGGSEVGDGILSPIGYQIAAGVSGEFNPVFLTID